MNKVIVRKKRQNFVCEVDAKLQGTDVSLKAHDTLQESGENRSPPLDLHAEHFDFIIDILTYWY